MEIDYFFRVPGQRGPYNIDGIPGSPLVLASIHPIVALEMADDRFDLDPLFQSASEPMFLAIRMRRFPLLRNRQSLDTPSSATVLTFFEGLIKASISSDFLRRLSNVLLDSADHLSQSLYIGNVVLIFRMGENQTVVILRKSNNGAELTQSG